MSSTLQLYKAALPFAAVCLQEYIEAILALQARHKKGAVLPLAIMTSGDTHGPTEDFLRANKYFGAKPSQIQLIKQEKVSICQ